MRKLVDQGFSEHVLSKASKAFNKWDADTNFPGAQPVSFQEEGIFSLQTEEYIVAEKSDG